MADTDTHSNLHQIIPPDPQDNENFQEYNIEQALEQTYGPTKYYQKRSMIVFSLQIFVCTIILVTPAYLFKVPTFHCKVGGTFP